MSYNVQQKSETHDYHRQISCAVKPKLQYFDLLRICCTTNRSNGDCFTGDYSKKPIGNVS